MSSSLRIALAEDNPHDVTLVRMALKGAGLEFDLNVLPDGDQAISFIETLDRDFRGPAIDLLLLDLHLPKRDGEEILKHLRSTERIAQTPVIVMTGSQDPESYETAARNAALHYFRKPSCVAEYMRLGPLVLDFFLSRKSDSNEKPPFLFAEGVGS